MRWSTMAAATVEAVLLGSLTAVPALADVVPVVEPSTSMADPAARVTQNPTPMLDSISGSWGSFMEPGVGGFVVADDVVELRVALPSELSSRFGEPWEFAVRTRDNGQTLSSGQVDASTGRFSAPVPQSLRGFSEVELVVTDYYQSGTSVPVPVTFSAILRVRADQNATSANIALTKATASSYGRSTMYGSSPQNARVAPGSTVTITSKPGTWTRGPDGDWANPAPIRAMLFAPGGAASFGFLPGTASADGSTVTVRIPRTSLTPYFPNGETSRPLTMQVDLSPAGSGLPNGTFSVQAYLELVPSIQPAVDRVEGPDRYSVAAAVAYRAFPDGADTAFVVTGANYPDALSAGPAAVHRDAPLLLTKRDSLPPAAAEVLAHLAARDVYVVGGPDSVSAEVVAQIESTGATVHRIGGADRYAASRALAADAFTGAGAGSGLVYIATGANFPDALAAGGAAGNAGAPVLLVRGAAPTLDAETEAQLRDLGVTRIKIAGGPASVSTGIEKALAAIAPTTRLAGPDRISAAAAINLDAYGTSERAFVVTGYKFPDALAGSAWAGKLGAPLYVSRAECLPPVVSAAFFQQKVKQVTLIGGPASLAPAVSDLDLCTG
jgi:putative cell wall-binding protein